MIRPLLTLYLGVRAGAATTLERVHRSQRGEGVISAAIAVLVMAFLGVALWVAFKGFFASTADKTGEQMSKIGS
ncbi:MAG: hypothetical protein JWM47_1455 [Acidimicrobiales bacterium]|nr:hypothetical protein [Acidimicrobiales bacterium]